MSEISPNWFVFTHLNSPCLSKYLLHKETFKKPFKYIKDLPVMPGIKYNNIFWKYMIKIIMNPTEDNTITCYPLSVIHL